ncbi:MAG: Calx-beta domain-containing protein, partial [Planctomycetota bacterium]
MTNRDDDLATLTISALSASQAEGTGGGMTDFVFQVELSRAVASGFNLGYTTSDGTATVADGDYVDNDGTLVFEGAKCEIKTFTVQVNRDNKVETDETFVAALGQMSNIAANLASRISFTSDRVTATIVNDDTATLLLSPVSTVLQEGTGSATTAFTYEVTLSAPVQGGLDISYSTDDATATTADGDYIDNDGVLSFTGTADERRTITVMVNQDDRVETDETFSVALHDVSKIDPTLVNSINIDGSPATGTISNDDTATLTITAVTASQVEGSAGATTEYRFNVTLSKAVQGGFNVAYTTDDGTATLADGDYIDNDGVLTFVGNANEVRTITVRVNQDLQIEPDELFQVALGQISGTSASIANSISITGSPASATILNDDVPRLVIAAVATSLQEGTSANGASFTFTVTLSDDIPDADGFDVAFATGDGTATAASGDYAANSGLLHFTGTVGEIMTITVEVLPDSVVEANETFQLALGEVTGLETGITINRVGTPSTVTILNDDTTTISISPLAASADEGTGVAHAFVVTLSNPVQGGVSVGYTTADGTATVADGDYVANTGTLTFAGTANETQSVTVVVNSDSKVEADEVFRLMLETLDVADAEIASSITLGDAVSVTIVNDDTAELTLAPVTASQTEGTGAATTDFTFRVTLSNPVQGGLTIAYSTNDGTATLADSDYVDNDGVLTFSGDANETKTITVKVNQDQKIEPSESFSVFLGAITQLDPTAADDITVSGSPVNATILNDDFPRLAVSAATASQAEGSGSGTTEYAFTVTLSDAVADADGFDVAYSTKDGTATLAGGDYADNDGVLHFNGTAGESHTVVVQVNRDAIVEADETFTFSLDGITGLATGETVVFDGSPLTATILNDDMAMLSLTTGTASQNEGSIGASAAFTFNVTLSAAVQGGFSVAYVTNDGSATVAAGDYVDNDGTLSFTGSAGETHTITVLVNGDNQVELDETFQVVLGALSLVANQIAANITVDNLPRTGAILNDDATTVTVSTSSTSVTEGTGTGTTDVAFQITLSNPVQGGFRIEYATNDGTATVANADYVDNDGSLTFNGTANETKTVVVQVRRDSLVERDERFAFALTQLSDINPALAQSVTVSTSPREVTILNDDTATISFVTAASSVAEANGTHTVEVVLNVNNSGSLGEAIVVNIASLPTSTALTPGDFLLNTTSVTFEAGSQSGARRTVSLTLQEDGLTEDPETINLQLSINGQVAGGGVTAGAANHVVTVTDDPMTGAIRGIVWADT